MEASRPQDSASSAHWDHQGAAQQQGKQPLHNITSSVNMVP